MRPLLLRLLLVFLLLSGPLSLARAHDLPRSSITLWITNDGAIAAVDLPVSGLALEPPELSPADLVTRRLTLWADGRRTTPELLGMQQTLSSGPVQSKTVQVRLHYRWPRPAPRRLELSGLLFPAEPTHQSFVRLYHAGALASETLLDRNTPTLTYAPGVRQKAADVFVRFVREGVHHIFIGPDHTLFIVGLLLMGGGLARLFRIATAFTIAHSITLSLACLGIVTPPSRLVEVTIAASIVVVGVHSLIARSYSSSASSAHRDLRLPLAFGFGLVHGFGFASALSALELPRYALLLSLFSFNLGVEIGQACILLAAAPALAWLCLRYPRAGGYTVTAATFLVIAAGAYWFGQRLAS